MYPKLTIIIPTYNRREQVLLNLAHILPQVLRNKEYVNIYVSDNASTDGTDMALNPYLIKYSHVLTYYKHETNISASQNFIHAVKSVQSEYVYILGDDDSISPYFVETVLLLIKEYPQVGLFHFNYIIGNNSLNNCLIYHKELNYSQLEEYENGSLFIKKLLNGLSFVSSNLFKRQLWLEGSEYYNEKCYGYEWLVIMLSGCLSYKCLYYHQPLLIQNVPSNNSYSDKWLLYYVAGLGNTFLSLDKLSHGIYQKWINYQQDDKIGFYMYISSIIGNRDFYKRHKNDMLLHIDGKIGKFYYSFLLKYVPVTLYKLVISNMLKILKRIF